MSSIRRGSSTRWGKLWGPEVARLLLMHDPNSRTFETNYDQGNASRDVAAPQLGERVAEAGDMRRMDRLTLER